MALRGIRDLEAVEVTPDDPADIEAAESLGFELKLQQLETNTRPARELSKLGHTVKLMPPAYVKAYVKRNKNDAADAEAICEAVARPSMRFVPVKDTEQQSVLMLHRIRNLLVRQRTMLVNALRANMAEFGSDVVADTLHALNVPYIAINPGASFRGLHDSLVNHLGNERPQLLLCLHEETAVAIAHGYAKVTGRAMAAAVPKSRILPRSAFGLPGLIRSRESRGPPGFVPRSSRSPLHRPSSAATRSQLTRSSTTSGSTSWSGSKS